MRLTIDARRHALNHEEAIVICNVLKSCGYQAELESDPLKLLVTSRVTVDVDVKDYADADEVLTIAERTTGRALVPLKCA